jgi:hypothetical protein
MLHNSAAYGFRQCFADFALPSVHHRRAPWHTERISRSGRISCFDARPIDAPSDAICIIQSSVNSTSVRLYAACVYAYLEGFGSTLDQLDLL